MMFRNAAGAMLILTVTMAMAQGTSPAPTVPGGAEVMQRRGSAGRRGLAGNQTRALPTATPLRQRVQDMESTLAQMHLVLKQMQDKAAKSKIKDSLAKANLDMWELMVGHLEKELQELKIAVAAREDMEARRAALYKQADAKAAAEAQAAQSGMMNAGPTPAATTAPQAAMPSAATPAPEAQTPSGQTASPAPATSATSPQ